ncbi:MAG: type I methionyl aminopeptidase [Firmicutes bacterium]|nr:type I methionyl aminopeptidase [Bacillota bacterium]
MIVIKSKDEIEIMAEAALVAAKMLRDLPGFIKPGISTKDIDKWVEDYIRSSGQKPGFKGYGGFPACACVSVNEEVVHGIPSKKRILQEGDIVSVDLGTIHKGFYSDAARTYPVGKISETHAKLIRVCEESFFEGLKYCRKGNRIGDISAAIQAHVEANGFSVIRDYTGHGVGRDMHEDPAVPNYGKAGHGPKLVPGMVIAIEPMIAVGDYDVEVLSNNWTAVTIDGSYASHYENTEVITEDEPRLLTCIDRDGYRLAE